MSQRDRRKVLLIGPTESLLRIAPILARAELDLVAVEDGSQALGRLGVGEYEAVVVRAPLEDDVATEMASRLGGAKNAAFRGVVILRDEEEEPLRLPDSPELPLVDLPAMS